MAGHHIDRAGRTGHGVEPHQELEILQLRTGRNLTKVHGTLQVGKIGDQVPGCLGSLAIDPGQQENLSQLIGVLDESNNGKRLPRGKSAGGRRVRGAFAR